MKVISGKYKGLKLDSLKGINTRPTLTRVKEDAFNILDNYFIYEKKSSLDLFGGSGALTIEGLSRGLSFAWINDSSKDAINIIKKNINKTGEKNYKITNYDYKFLLENLKQKAFKFDIVYLDPPFANTASYTEVLSSLIGNNILKKWGIVIIESEGALEKEILQEYILIKHKGYNKKNLYILRLEKTNVE